MKPLAKRLEVVVPGDYCGIYERGNAGKKLKVGNATWVGAGVMYAERLLFNTKCAMIEQGWELTDKPLYVGIILYRKPPTWGEKSLNGVGISKVRQTVVNIIRPSIENLLRQHLFTLKGIVFKKTSQITASLLLRFYDNEPRTEIIFGQPSNVKELLHDIRNL